MGRITALIFIAFLASASAAPTAQLLPLTYYPVHQTPRQPCLLPSPAVAPCQQETPSPSEPATPNPGQPQSTCEDITEPYSNGNEQIKVHVQKNAIPERLRQLDFREVPVQGGTFYISPTPDVLIQPPPILVKPAKQPPINPAEITVQPPCLPPITPNPIVVKPPRLPPITPEPVLARPKPLAPIQPPTIVVRPPKPERIQPAPISVTQPNPSPINLPQIIVRQPCPPTLQPPTVVIQASSLQNKEPSPCENSGNMYPFGSPCPLSPC